MRRSRHLKPTNPKDCVSTTNRYYWTLTSESCVQSFCESSNVRRSESSNGGSTWGWGVGFGAYVPTPNKPQLEKALH